MYTSVDAEPYADPLAAILAANPRADLTVGRLPLRDGIGCDVCVCVSSCHACVVVCGRPPRTTTRSDLLAACVALAASCASRASTASRQGQGDS